MLMIKYHPMVSECNTCTKDGDSRSRAVPLDLECTCMSSVARSGKVMCAVPANGVCPFHTLLHTRIECKVS